MVKTRILLGAAALLTAFSLGAEAAKLNKWVDKDGVTHYGDVVPPEYADRPQTQLEKGIETKKQAPARPGPAKQATEPGETPEQIEQKRHDQALLGTYSSVDEIDQAMNRNLQQVNTQLNTIQLQMKSLEEDKARLEAEASKKPGDVVIQGELAQTNARIAKLQGEQDKAMARADKIKAEFAKDKQRYIELTSGGK